MVVLVDWFESIPKIELHLHVEGAIPYEALWTLVEKYGGDPLVSSISALKAMFIYRDFPHFIDTWVWKNSFLREYEDFTFISEAVAQNLALQNIKYAEVFISPPDFKRHGLETQRLIEAVRLGLSRVKEIEIALVPDLVRDFGPEKAWITLSEVYEVKDQGVVGIGIGGSEQAFPPEPFADVYEKAHHLGLYTTIHAGEAAGAESIWGALLALDPDRIGHGTHAKDDKKLLDYLKEHQIPIEMCPISNLKTGIIPSIEYHPIKDFFEYGLKVSVNTDDPKMFGNSLAEEYRLLVDVLGFSKQEIQSIILQGIQSSWLSSDRKKEMANEFKISREWKKD